MMSIIAIFPYLKTKYVIARIALIGGQRPLDAYGWFLCEAFRICFRFGSSSLINLKGISSADAIIIMHPI